MAHCVVDEVTQHRVEQGRIALDHAIAGRVERKRASAGGCLRSQFRQHRLRHLNWEQRDREFFDSLDPAILDTALEFMNAYNGYLERKLAEEMAAGDPSERIADGDAPEDDGVTPCADNFL